MSNLLTMYMRHLVLVCLPLLSAFALAAPPELVLLAPNNHAMPIAQFNDGVLERGIMKDVGEAIAARLGRPLRFVSAPSRRVALMLAQGDADGVCYLQPYWIDGDYRWSAPMIPNGALVIARADAPVVRGPADLAGKKVGTVAGYRYPYWEQALGKEFKRDDAPSMQHNLRKLEAGRTQYALIELATYDFEIKNNAARKLRGDFVYETYKGSCAFSLKSKVPFDEVNRAIESLIADGSVEQIMARYR
jgi:polar amino acid transport system substrate-binding protein